MLGTRIASLRKKRGMSQAVLAAHLHVSPSAVGMYEQGRRMPNNTILIALSEEFHVTADYLLTGRCWTPNDKSSCQIHLLDLILNNPDNENAQRPYQDILFELLGAILAENGKP